MNRAQTIDPEWAQARFAPGTPSPTVLVAIACPQTHAEPQAEPERKIAFAHRDKRLGKNALALLRALALFPRGLTAREAAGHAHNGDLSLVNGTLGNLQVSGYAICLRDGKPAHWRITELGAKKAGATP